MWILRVIRKIAPALAALLVLTSVVEAAPNGAPGAPTADYLAELDRAQPYYVLVSDRATPEIAVIPASLLREHVDSVTVLLDDAAAARL